MLAFQCGNFPLHISDIGNFRDNQVLVDAPNHQLHNGVGFQYGAYRFSDFGAGYIGIAIAGYCNAGDLGITRSIFFIVKKVRIVVVNAFIEIAISIAAETLCFDGICYRFQVQYPWFRLRKGQSK